LANYYGNTLFETSDGLDFVTVDEEDFYVNDGYFEDTENSQLNINTISFSTYMFAGNNVKKLKLHYTQSLLTDQLAIDTMTAEVVSATKPAITRYTPITVRRGTAIKGVYFDGQIEEVGYQRYSIYAKSYLSLLDYDYHFGGMYAGTDVGDIIAEIMGDIPYTIHPDLASIKVYGYLPYAKKRENLQQILLATGAAIRKNADGTINFTALTDIEAGTFSDTRAFIDGSVGEDPQVTAVQVTEHAYVAITDPITLFSESFNDIRTIVFTEPAHDLSCANGTIISSGANYAVVQGAGAVVLTGQKYRHTTKIVTAGSLLGTPEDKILSVKNATLITAINSSSIVQRLYTYASCYKTVRQDILIDQERVGDAVKTINPYGDDYLSAMIQSLDFDLSNIVRASGTFLVGYTPQGVSGGYQNQVVLRGTGNWTVPAGVTEYMAVLIGGAQGGRGGQNGQDGGEAKFVWNDNYSVYDGGLGGEPGEGGLPGSSGNVYQIIGSTSPGNSIAYNCGIGGEGGNPEEEGSPGTATIFGSYSSASGSELENGFVDIFTGKNYALPGINGKTGAPGGDGARKGTAQPGSDTETGTGGVPGTGLHQPDDDAGGGGGGGAAENADGEAGENAYYDPDYTGSRDGRMISGDGGDGASPQAPADSTDGKGGDGGHGGGGGGGAGGYIYDDNDREYSHSLGSPGQKGAGSKGGKGGNGLIIVYY